jgi:hypothetical protein
VGQEAICQALRCDQIIEERRGEEDEGKREEEVGKEREEERTTNNEQRTGTGEQGTGGIVRLANSGKDVAFCTGVS